MSVKEMYVIPKEVYHSVMNSLSENEKRLVDQINVEQLNVSCGPQFADVNKAVSCEESEEKSEEKNEDLTTPIVLSNPNNGARVLPILPPPPTQSPAVRVNAPSRLVDSSKIKTNNVVDSSKIKTNSVLDAKKTSPIGTKQKTSPNLSLLSNSEDVGTETEVTSQSAESKVYDNILGAFVPGRRKELTTSPQKKDSFLNSTEVNDSDDDGDDRELTIRRRNSFDDTSGIYDQSSRYPTSTAGVQLFADESKLYGASNKPFQTTSSLHIPVVAMVNTSIQELVQKDASLNPQESAEIQRSATKQKKATSSVKSLTSAVEANASNFYGTSKKKKTPPKSMTTRLGKEKKNLQQISEKRKLGLDVPFPKTTKRVNYKE